MALPSTETTLHASSNRKLWLPTGPRHVPTPVPSATCRPGHAAFTTGVPPAPWLPRRAGRGAGPALLPVPAARP